MSERLTREQAIEAAAVKYLDSATFKAGAHWADANSPLPLVVEALEACNDYLRFTFPGQTFPLQTQVAAALKAAKDQVGG